MIIVGKNNSADFTNLADCIDYLVANKADEMQTVIILQGHYHEKIEIILDNIHFIGLGEVEIEYNASANQLDENGQAIGTFKSPTVYIQGENLKFSNLKFVNSSGQGELVGQAVAVFVTGDKIIFDQCEFHGYQDTLCIGPIPAAGAHNEINNPNYPMIGHRRVYFCHCFISGTVDYIFGGGNAIFNACQLYTLDRLNEGDTCWVTAASTSSQWDYGFTFYRSIFTSETPRQTHFLGRPWRPYSMVRLVNCYMDEGINPLAWDTWAKHSDNIEKVRYSEIDLNPAETKFKKYNRPSWVRIKNDEKSLESIIQEQFLDWKVLN